MDKYQILRDLETNGYNYDVGTTDIIQKLQNWDAKYGIEIADVESDKLIVTFKNLPEDLNDIALEIYDFCPDTIDQGFGCTYDMITMLQESQQEIPVELQEMIEGIDFDDDNYGLDF